MEVERTKPGAGDADPARWPRVVTATAFVALTLAAGCGSDKKVSNGPGPVPEKQQNSTSYTEQQVVQALKLEPDPNTPGGQWDPATKCVAAVIMTTASEVSIYADAGDPVASNPSRTAGVKYSGYEDTDESECHRVFTARLKALK